MSKETFLKELKNSLSGINPDEIREVIADYKEYFEAGVEKGRDEKEIAQSLGDPQSLAAQLKFSSKIKRAENHYSFANISRAVMATLGLGMLNLIFIVGPYFGLVGMLIGLFMAGVGAFAGGVVSIIIGILTWAGPSFVSQYSYIGIHPAAVIMFGVSATCFGILFLIGCGYLAKWFYIYTVKYLKLNLKVITGDKE